LHTLLAPSNNRIQPTPLRGPKIVAILKPGFNPIATPIYQCGAADAERWAAPFHALYQLKT